MISVIPPYHAHFAAVLQTSKPSLLLVHASTFLCLLCCFCFLLLRLNLLLSTGHFCLLSLGKQTVVISQKPEPNMYACFNFEIIHTIINIYLFVQSVPIFRPFSYLNHEYS